jgi:hypothetical protein
MPTLLRSQDGDVSLAWLDTSCSGSRTWVLPTAVSAVSSAMQPDGVVLVKGLPERGCNVRQVQSFRWSGERERMGRG